VERLRHIRSPRPKNGLGKFHPVKIINIFNGVPKSKLRKIKILMGINIKLGENVLNDMDQVKSNLSC